MQKMNEEKQITFIFSSHDKQVMDRAKRLIILKRRADRGIMMPKKFLVNFLIFLFIFSIDLKAQYDFSFSGYVVNLPIYQQSNENLSKLFGFKKDMFFDLTRVRLRPVLDLWDNARINAEYEISALYFNSTGNFLIIPSDKNKQTDF